MLHMMRMSKHVGVCIDVCIASGPLQLQSRWSRLHLTNNTGGDDARARVVRVIMHVS